MPARTESVETPDGNFVGHVVAPTTGSGPGAGSDRVGAAVAWPAVAFLRRHLQA